MLFVHLAATDIGEANRMSPTEFAIGRLAIPALPEGSREA
jgi:hypothetical protein